MSIGLISVEDAVLIYLFKAKKWSAVTAQCVTAARPQADKK